MVQTRPATLRARSRSSLAPREKPMVTLNPKMQPQRIQMSGLDDVVTSYVTTPYAAEILDVSRRVVQAACSRYWKRVTTARAEGVDVDLTPKGAQKDELYCIRLSAGRDAQYWVRENTMKNLFVNKRDASGKLPKPGRPAGTGGTKRSPNKPKSNPSHPSNRTMIPDD